MPDKVLNDIMNNLIQAFCGLFLFVSFIEQCNTGLTTALQETNKYKVMNGSVSLARFAPGYTQFCWLSDLCASFCDTKRTLFDV